RLDGRTLRGGKASGVEMRSRLLELLLGPIELGAMRVELSRCGERVERLTCIADRVLGVALRVAFLLAPEPPPGEAEEQKQHDQPDLFEALDRDQVPVDGR